MQSAVTKVFVGLVGQGFSAILSSWTIYVLIVTALVGFALQQSALRTGVLAPAMASSNAVTLFGSVAFGAAVFGESLSSGGARPAPALIGLAVALGRHRPAGGRAAPTSIRRVHSLRSPSPGRRPQSIAAGP